MVDGQYRSAQKEDHEVFPCTWYAIGWSKELKDKPIKKRILGRDIVLFRDQQGTAHALHAYCPHRGADLSLGRCVGGLLECAYHAWSFDGHGQCVDIPAHPGRAVPAFANTKSYPLIERIGLLWIYPMTRDLLDYEPEALKLVSPVLENPDYVLAPYDAIWQAHLTRVVESVLDVAHVPIVHNKTIGKKSPKEINIEFEAKDNRIRIRNGGGILDYDFPQQWLLTPVKTEGSQFINFVTFSPIEQEVTAIYGLAGRNFAKFPGMNYIFSRYSSKVLKEDQGIVESQHPRPIPDALRLEAHVPADGPQVRFRQRWYQFLTSSEPKIMISEAKA